jgi:hypothetical protein
VAPAGFAVLHEDGLDEGTVGHSKQELGGLTIVGDDAANFLGRREGEALGECGPGGGRELAKILEGPGRFVVQSTKELAGTVAGEPELGDDGIEFRREEVIE